MKDIINKNYESVVKRGCITPSTTAYEFIDKMYEELSEFEEELSNFIDSNPTSFNKYDNLKEELSDIVLVCLNFAKHYDIDIEHELNKKILKNYERVEYTNRSV